MLKFKNIVAGTGLGVVLALSVAANSVADFDAAVKAYEAGDYSKAIQEWQLLASKDDPAAMRNVGHMYRRGLGVDQDFSKALSWYTRAASMGFDRAQANVASMYLRGQGVPQDYVEAASWFTKAARNGHTIAQYNLGLMYEHGKGVERSGAKALAWYNLAAKAGHKQALDKVSLMVAIDPDVKEEVVLAPKAETTAASNPDPVAEVLKPEDNVVQETVTEPVAKVALAPVVKATPAADQTVAVVEKATESSAKKFDPFALSANNLQSGAIEKTGSPTVFNQSKNSKPSIPTETTASAESKVTVVPALASVAVVEPKINEKAQVTADATVEPAAMEKASVAPQSATVTPAAEPEEKKGFFDALKSLVMGDDESKPSVVAAVAAPAVAAANAPSSPALSPAIPAPQPMAAVQSVHLVPGSGLSVDERLEMASLSFAVEEYQQALSVWAPLAQEGNSEAQFNLGQMFYEGYAVPVDRVKAYQWWARAKANGSTVAATSLSKLAPSLTYLEKRRLQIVN